MARFLALLLSSALLASACTSGPGDAPEPDAAAHERLASILTEPFDEGATVDAAIEALARAGVRTYEDEGQELIQQVAGRPSPLEFLRHQVETMSLAATGSAGFGAVQLDGLAPPPPDQAPPLSAIVAGYVAEADTFGARLSRELMGGANFAVPEGLTFPDLVIALFLADILPPAEQSPMAFAQMGFGPVAQLEGFCAELKGFLDGVLGAITSAIDSLSSIPIIGQITPYLGAVLSYPAQVLADLVNSVPFIAWIKKALGLAGVLITAASALKPWSLSLSAMPIAPHYQVEGEPEVTGTFTANVVLGADPLQTVRPCAEIAGISLPSTQTATGTPVIWTPVQGFSDHLVETDRDMTIGGDGRAGLAWRTMTETASAHETGELSTANPTVEVGVDQDFFDIAGLATQLFGSGILLDTIKQILGPLVSDAEAALQKILDLSGPTGAIAVALDYHLPGGFMFTMVDENEGRIWTWTGRSCNGYVGPWAIEMELDGIGVLEGSFGFGETELTLPSDTEPGMFKGEVPTSLVAGGIGFSGTFRYKVMAAVTGQGSNMRLDINESFTGPTSISGLQGIRNAPMEPLPENAC